MLSLSCCFCKNRIKPEVVVSFGDGGHGCVLRCQALNRSEGVDRSYSRGSRGRCRESQLRRTRESTLTNAPGGALSACRCCWPYRLNLRLLHGHVFGVGGRNIVRTRRHVLYLPPKLPVSLCRGRQRKRAPLFFWVQLPPVHVLLLQSWSLKVLWTAMHSRWVHRVGHELSPMYWLIRLIRKSLERLRLVLMTEGGLKLLLRLKWKAHYSNLNCSRLFKSGDQDIITCHLY